MGSTIIHQAYTLTLTTVITALAESGRKAKAQLRIDVIPV